MFDLSFLYTVFSLAVLETLLSLDNAVILALIARELKPKDQAKALRYGLFGAVVLRLLAVGFATKMVQVQWIKTVGGAYLLWLAIKYFANRGSDDEKKTRTSPHFWIAVMWIELTDLVFAIDSILAAVAITDDYWAIVTGGLLGVVMIRFAAQYMIQLLKRFPRIESLAYLLVAAVGIKVLYQVIHSA